MMSNRAFDERFEQRLSVLEQGANLRVLRSISTHNQYITNEDGEFINLSSNDYLGLASDTTLQHEFMERLSDESLLSHEFLMSNPSSRLITGNSYHYQILESRIAALFGDSSRALVLGSGYLLGVGIFGALTTKGDTIIADKLVHSSIIDGIKLSEATLERFRHNDMNHLESILKRCTSERVMVVTESLFSMDGDFAPLAELAELQSRYDFMLYLDEAHAFGAMGLSGRGAAYDVPGLRVDLRVATLGKAMASQGAFVVCSELIYKMLVNSMRSLIFSTALPPMSLMWSDFLISKLDEFQERRNHLWQLVDIMDAQSYIVPIMAGSNENALRMAGSFAENGFWATAIRHPTVPKDRARVRVSLSATLSVLDVQKFKLLCNTIG